MIARFFFFFFQNRKSEEDLGNWEIAKAFQIDFEGSFYILRGAG